ncbi:MAG TPA: NADH-quinone oxidoreductase subunit L [Tepidisphaeraceae bacterium]|nr:NADH-quinone oxidoreductase subunit L [Tepidisphaeraceae bacterium]
MQDFFAIQYCWLIPLLPLIGAAVSGFFGARWLKEKSHWPIWIGVGISAIFSIALLVRMMFATPGADGTIQFSHHVYWWIVAGQFKADVGYFFDPLTAVMLCVVCGIGFFICVYSAGYMAGETGYFRFFAYMGLFIFSMTNLVMGSNLIMLYLGWEGVGLCSYLLIGYYYEKPSAREAAKKAFLVNRIGDFGFGLGIMLVFKAFGTIHFYSDSATGVAGVLDLARVAIAHPATHPYQIAALHWIPFLLMLGAFGKSAQFPLYVWLPDAMEGPTPVSALIHAATMVTAGVYMIARCSELFVTNHAAMLTVALIGAFTAIFAATIALRQFDLKKVFAYSTISQLGYMFVGVGLFAPVPAVFHLVTHAFFKALLFLSCGVVMHAMLGHLDMRKMSGLKRVLPWTNWLILAGCLALAGFPLTSGFFSKDEIVDQAHIFNLLIYIAVLAAAFMTAYYTFRLYFRVFQGPLVVPTEPAEAPAHAAADEHGADSGHSSAMDLHGGHDSHHGAEHHNHEPAIMIVPLIVLAIGAIFAGYLNWPAANLGHFLGHSPSFKYGYEMAVNSGVKVEAATFGQVEPAAAGAAAPLIPMSLWIGGAVSVAGILLAAFLHLLDRGLAAELADRMAPVVRVLDAKFWVDEVYQAYIVEPLRTFGQICFAFDRFIIDGLVALVGAIPSITGFIPKTTVQRGYLQGYGAAMVTGMAAVLLFIFSQAILAVVLIGVTSVLLTISIFMNWA